MHHFDDQQRYGTSSRGITRAHPLMYGFALTLLFLVICWAVDPVLIFRLTNLILQAAIGVLCLLTLVLGMVLGIHFCRARLVQRKHHHPPIHNAPMHLVESSSDFSGTFPAYPPEQFFSYDPLNKRSPEHLNPDQGNRF